MKNHATMSQRRRTAFLGALLGVALAFGPATGAVPATDDPYRPAQWALSRIGAEQAWTTSTGAGIRIGIVDSGIDLTHEDLSGAVVAHTNCIGSDGDPARCQGSAQDDNGHGTHVAGIVAARAHNGKGVAGVAPEAQLVIAKALDATGAGSVADIVAGIKWVVDHGAQVVNLSLGDPNFVFTSLFGTPMAEGVEYAWAHGAVPVLAAGNQNVLGLGSSNYGGLNTIVVGATGPDDRIARYSSPLGNAKWAVVAPGGAAGGNAAHDVLSTFWVSERANGYEALAGTSMAAPHVSGTLACCWPKASTPEPPSPGCSRPLTTTCRAAPTARPARAASTPSGRWAGRGIDEVAPPDHAAGRAEPAMTAVDPNDAEAPLP